MADDDKHVSGDDPVDEVKEKISSASDEMAKQNNKWADLSDTAQELVVSDKGIRQLVGAMVASRQLYAMALHDLDYRLDSSIGNYKDIVEEDKSPLKEIFVSSAASQAANPFEESDLLSGVKNTVIPWMEEVSAAHTAAEDRLLVQEHEAAEKERRSKKVSLGLGLEPEEEDSLDRERSLVLGGWGPALDYLSSRIIGHSLSAVMDFNQVIHLTMSATKSPDHRLLEIGGKAWENCARSNASWNKLFVSEYLDKLSAPLDLFVISDLSLTNKGHSFQSAASLSAEAQKRLRKWSNSMGCAMVGCIPLLSQETPDLNTPDWEKLRMFTRLRAVTVNTRDDGNYDILVGRTGKLENIPKEDVDSFEKSDIIKP